MQATRGFIPGEQVERADLLAENELVAGRRQDARDL